MNETKKILEMIESGKMTATEGMELLKAMEAGGEKNQLSKKKYKGLRIQVKAKEDNMDINVNIPLALLKFISGFVNSVEKFIPDEANNKIKNAGIELKELDLKAIVEAIENGSLEDPTLMDIQINNEKEGRICIKIYLD